MHNNISIIGQKMSFQTQKKNTINERFNKHNNPKLNATQEGEKDGKLRERREKE